MATHEDKQMLRDANGDLIPQYWDIQDEEFKPLTGQDGAQDTRLTGSNAEEEYNGKTVLRTRLIVLAYINWDFDKQSSVIVVAGVTVQETDYTSVNGFGTLACVVRCLSSPNADWNLKARWGTGDSPSNTNSAYED